MIFDVAGVLISNFSPQFWDEIVTYAEERSATDLRRHFKSELRQDLWSGAVPDTAFFTWISAQIPAVHAQEVERILLISYRCPPWNVYHDGASRQIFISSRIIAQSGLLLYYTPFNVTSPV